MDETISQAVTEDCKRVLRTYLRDHVAGAQHAIQLFQALHDVHPTTAVGQETRDLLQQVTEDLVVLKHMASSLGAEDFELKELAGWLADKLGRLKLAPLDRSFNTFEALEFLCLGILGKRALWNTLMLIRSEYPALAGVDFAALIERADLQYAATEQMRLAMALQAFSVVEVQKV